MQWNVVVKFGKVPEKWKRSRMILPFYTIMSGRAVERLTHVRDGATVVFRQGIGIAYMWRDFFFRSLPLLRRSSFTLCALICHNCSTCTLPEREREREREREAMIQDMRCDRSHSAVYIHVYDLMYTGIRTGYNETNDTCAHVWSDLGNCPSSNNHQGDRDWTAQNLRHDVP